MNTASADFPKKVLTTNRAEGEKIRVVELPEIEDERGGWPGKSSAFTELAGDGAILRCCTAPRASRCFGAGTFEAQSSVCNLQTLHTEHPW